MDTKIKATTKGRNSAVATKPAVKARVQRKAPAKAKAVAKAPVAKSGLAVLQKQLNHWLALIGGVNTAIMLVDKDFVVTFANTAAVDLMSKHADEIQSVFTPPISANQ